MSLEYKVEIISPDKTIFSGNSDEVILPCFEGEVTVLKDHIPLITFLRPGIINIKDSNDEKKYYIEEGGTFNDITPIRTGSPTSAGVITFAATTSAPFSSTITVTHTNHGAVAGDFVTFSSAASLGGNVNANVLNQEHSIDGMHQYTNENYIRHS